MNFFIVSACIVIFVPVAYYVISIMLDDYMKNRCPKCKSKNVSVRKTEWNMSYSLTEHMHCNDCGHNYEKFITD